MTEVSPSDHDPIYPGEHITCDNGHTIGVVVRRCIPGRTVTDWVDAIIWSQPKPVTGKLAICTECGAQWLLRQKQDGDRLAAWICVDKSWRPELSYDAEVYLGKRPKEELGFWLPSDWEEQLDALDRDLPALQRDEE